jgi:hypothetical protein
MRSDRPRLAGADSDRPEEPVKMRFVEKPLGTCSKWRMWRSWGHCPEPQIILEKKERSGSLPFQCAVSYRVMPAVSSRNKRRMDVDCGVKSEIPNAT